jgi:hypothetical protein
VSGSKVWVWYKPSKLSTAHQATAHPSFYFLF